MNKKIISDDKIPNNKISNNKISNNKISVSPSDSKSLNKLVSKKSFSDSVSDFDSFKMANARFEMIKKRHGETFLKALNEGKMDEQLIELCHFFKNSKNYFTSSGCAGRILLLGLKKGESKKDSFFHRKWHSTTSFDAVMDGLNESVDADIWFKAEPFILHIGARDEFFASKILNIMKEVGVKRGGIMITKPGKYILELQGTQSISCPVKVDGKIVVSEDYLKLLIKKANEKVTKNYSDLEILFSKFKEVLHKF